VGVVVEPENCAHRSVPIGGHAPATTQWSVGCRAVARFLWNLERRRGRLFSAWNTGPRTLVSWLCIAASFGETRLRLAVVESGPQAAFASSPWPEPCSAQPAHRLLVHKQAMTW